MNAYQIAARLITVCASGAIAVVAAGSNIGQAADNPDILRVFMNQARILKLSRPVAKVIVGNANVADATVADAQTIVLTGRAYGTTNLVLLDAGGRPIVDKRVLVSIDEGNTVRMFKQTERTVYSCTPNCEEHADLQSTASSSSSSSSPAQ